MAELQDDGQLFLTNTEIHVLEEEFFQFEKSLDSIDADELRPRLLKLKWEYLHLRERLKVLERDPTNQIASKPLK